MNAINSMLMKKEEYNVMFKNEENLWWYKGLQDILLHYITKFGDENSLILDAGCGTGKNMEILLKRGFKVFGIDISNDAINFCKLRNIKNVEICQISKINFPSNYFDVVYCSDVLGNLNDELIDNAMKEFYRVLKKNGILIIHCAALNWLKSQHDKIVSIKKRFNKKEIINLLSSNKFAILKCSYRVFFLFPLIAVTKLVKKFYKKSSLSSDQWLPPKIINDILTWVQLIENYLFFKFNLPIGSSIFALAKKTNILF